MSVASEYLQHSRDSADELVRRHAPLVRRIAYHLMGRLPASVDVNDLIQAGMLGLLEAARNFATYRGASFEIMLDRMMTGTMVQTVGTYGRDAAIEMLELAIAKIEAGQLDKFEGLGRVDLN